jgi:putative ABC transport system substrate-binding protein
MIPGLARLAVLGGPAGGTARAIFEHVRSGLAGDGTEVLYHQAGSAAEVDAAFATMVLQRTQAVLPIPAGFLRTQVSRIAHLTSTLRLPLVSTSREFDGFLLVYGAERFALQRRTANYIDRIVRGAKPADLPIEQPTTFELVVNARIARDLGLTIPTAVLARADEVIE